jgi:hypothetical protein
MTGRLRFISALDLNLRECLTRLCGRDEGGSQFYDLSSCARGTGDQQAAETLETNDFGRPTLRNSEKDEQPQGAKQ